MRKEKAAISLNIERKRIGDLKPADYNPRKITKREIAKLANSITEFGYVQPIVWNKKTKHIVGGHQRFKFILENNGEDETVDVSVVDLTLAKEKALNIALNKIGGMFDDTKLVELLEAMEKEDFALTGFEDDELKLLKGKLEQDDYKKAGKDIMKTQFIAPPFSVLDAKQEYWQERKRQWLAMGLKSHEGRDIEATNTSKTDYMQGRGNNEGGSIFDPVLAEVLYRWFVPEGGFILDPFAGGSVRGIVAAKTGRRYVGIDIRKEQVKANYKQSSKLLDEEPAPDWITGDSLNIAKLAPKHEYNFVFSCPPYADLETYSDNKADISNMPYDEFMAAYTSIIRETMELLANDSFAAFVVGDIRNKKGFYRNFVSDTITAFRTIPDVELYNEIVYLTPLGTLPIRAKSSFTKGRKVGKAHQNVLVFVKGDPKKAAAKLKAVPDTPDE